MRRIILVLAGILFLTDISAQVQLQNGGFESNSVTCCNGGSCGNITPFNNGEVSNWSASHGSPHLTKAGMGCTGFHGIVFFENNSCFLNYRLSNDSLNPEGIFQNYITNKLYTYNFTIRARRVGSAASRIKIKLTSGLSNYASGDRSPTIPNPALQQLIVDQLLPDTFTQIIVEGVHPDADYTQLWIYCLDGDIIVDGVNIYQTCCEAYQVYQNITNPPTTYRNNYIRAGENIIDSLSHGKVIINKDAGFVIFQAGDEVELLPGFETEDSADFEAKIAPCSEVPMQVSLTELIPEVDDFPCMRKLKAEACYGSGFLKIIWPDGLSDGDGESILFSPKDYPSVEVKFVDLYRNDTIIKSVDFSNEPFFGDFHVSFGNFVTANGDGINDIWVAGDDVESGAAHFAYNAYSFYLEINNRWGQTVFDRYWENKNDGFADKSIKWDDPDLCENPDGTYFGLLDLRNCSHAEEDFISFSVTLDCVNNFVQKLSNEEILNNSQIGDVIKINSDSILLLKSELHVYPNPTQNSVTLKYNCQKDASLFIEITNSIGIVVKTIKTHFNKGTNLQMISLENLPNGVYTLKVATEEKVFFEKIIKE